jgi:sugar lactone lactonase YvrE
MFLRKLFTLTTLFLAISLLAFAEGTRTWEQSKYEDFQKGTPHGVAISSDGTLELAPAFKLVATTPASAVWATAVGPQGGIYAATGGPGRVYRILPGGQPVAIFQPQELQIQALVVDKNDVLYAATNPDGKVYRIEHVAGKTGAKDEKAKSQSEAEWKSSVYFDPGTKYIWDLALDDSGNLFVATGDHGEIFKVSANGEHSLFFKSDEPHIRVLAFDALGNLIAGSDGSGLIYRITPKGEGFVLYSAPKREITSLAVDKAGNIYLAAAGEKRSGGAAALGPTVVIAPPTPTPTATPPGAPQAAAPAPEPPVTLNPSNSAGPGGSEIYRISTDGSPELWWSSHDDLVYTLAFDQKGRLLAGTGNKGKIFAVPGRDDYTDLIKAEANQVTAFTKAPGGGLYASTSNLGKIFLLSAAPDGDGSYESDVFDAHIFSKWGRAEFRGSGNVELFARSGNVDNPDRNWSAWKKIDLDKDAAVTAPPARFVQWKAVLHPAALHSAALHSDDAAPRVESVTLNYLPKNVAPEFDDIMVTPGVRYQALPRPPNTEASQHFDAPPAPIHDRQSVGVKWMVHDDNDDQLTYSVYYRGDGQTRWLLLKGNLSDKFYSFDASLLPDGGYTVKVIASDAPSHSPQEALSAEKESSRFEVDTTPPQIVGIKAVVHGNDIHVQFRVTDAFSPIKRVEYSVDANDWHFVEPIGQLSDSKSENYDFEAEIPGERPIYDAEKLATTGETATEEHVVVVRAYDRFDNMTLSKVVIDVIHAPVN